MALADYTSTALYTTGRRSAPKTGTMTNKAAHTAYTQRIYAAMLLQNRLPFYDPITGESG